MRRLIYLLPLWLPLLAWAEGSRSTEDWLNRISAAAHQNRYAGVFVMEQDGRVETFRIFHGAGGPAERTHIVSLDGPHREVVRNPEETRIYLPQIHTVRVENHSTRRYFPALIEAPLSSYQDLYTIEEQGLGHVAGFECQWLRFRPRDDFRYGYQICVERNSGLLLRADSLGADGHPLQTSFFSQLLLGPNATEEPMPNPARGSEWRIQTISQQGTETSDWRVTALPPGFRKLAEVKMQGKRPGEPVIHQVYSDGLASVSVFIEPEDNHAHLERPHSPFRSMNVYHLDVSDHKVFVVGEVPPDTLARMGQSLVFSIRSQHP
jgi:sigma-E factor negative regulatory protein RseB